MVMRILIESEWGTTLRNKAPGEELQQVCLAETWSPETNGWRPPNRWLDLRFASRLQLQRGPVVMWSPVYGVRSSLAVHSKL